MKTNGLKCRTSTTEDLIIARENKVNEHGEVLEWIKEVNAKLPKLETFMTFIAVSGLRFVQGVNSYNLILYLVRKEEISNYYNFERKILRHYLFKQLFVRRTKKALICCVPISFIKRISKSEKITTAQINNLIKRSKLKSRFGDVSLILRLL